MANEEIKYFNVKNISVRLVHIGGVAVPPEKVVALVDDEGGINRLDVESSDYLEETDEDVSPEFVVAEPEQPEAKKTAARKTTKNTAAPGGNNTPTGQGWNAGNKQ